MNRTKKTSPDSPDLQILRLTPRCLNSKLDLRHNSTQEDPSRLWLWLYSYVDKHHHHHNNPPPTKWMRPVLLSVYGTWDRRTFSIHHLAIIWRDKGLSGKRCWQEVWGMGSGFVPTTTNVVRSITYLSGVQSTIIEYCC